MVQIVGSYKLEKNENLDAFYEAAGVPWIARKMMLVSSPTMYISKDKDENEDDCWCFKTVSFIRTVEQSFKLKEEYDENMPSGDVFKSVATLEGDTFIIKSEEKDEEVEEKGESDTETEAKEEKVENRDKADKLRFERDYEFNEDGLVITLKHPSGAVAKRYFKRIN